MKRTGPWLIAAEQKSRELGSSGLHNDYQSNAYARFNAEGCVKAQGGWLNEGKCWREAGSHDAAAISSTKQVWRIFCGSGACMNMAQRPMRRWHR